MYTDQNANNYYLYRFSLGGFANFREGVPRFIDQLYQHESTGEKITPNVYVIAPSEACRLFSFAQGE